MRAQQPRPFGAWSKELHATFDDLPALPRRVIPVAEKIQKNVHNLHLASPSFYGFY